MESMSEKLQKGRILSRIIIEMVGAPKDHIEKTIIDYVGKLKGDDNIEVIKESIEEAIPQEQMFATFAELEIWFKDITHLLAFCIDALPSSVEILEPGEFRVTAPNFSGFINDLQSRLHEIDMLLKQKNAKIEISNRNGENIIKNFIMFALENGKKTKAELAEILRIKKEQVQPFIDNMEQLQLLKQNGEFVEK